MNSESQPKTSGKRVILKRILIGIAIFALVAAAIVFFTIRKLTPIANWAAKSVTPESHVEFQNVTLQSPTTSHVDEITVRSPNTGEILYQARDVTITYSLPELVNNHIRDIKAAEVIINITDDFDQALKDAPTNNSPAKTWSVGNLTCTYGAFSMNMNREKPFFLSTKFTLSLTDVGTVPELLQNIHKVTLWDLNAGIDRNNPFIRLDLIEAKLSLGQLQEKKLGEVKLSGGGFTFGNAFQEFISSTSETDTEKTDDGWTLDRLIIEGVSTRISDLGTSIPDIQFTLQTTLNNLSPKAAVEQLGKVMQQIEISDVNIYSPYDPFIKVITLKSVFVRFSLQQLLEKKINDITILGPTIYISRDLFGYMAEKEEKADLGEKQSGWIIGKLNIDFGKLVIAEAGTEEINLPLTFRTKAENVSFSNLASLHLNTSLAVPEQDYKFPSYQLELEKLHGDIKLAYPAGSGKNNLVPDLRLKQARWKQYISSDVWVAITFDKQGINGKFGGKAYGGEVGGGFSFFFQDNSPWIGWLYGNHVDLNQLTNIIAPENFHMTGPFSFRAQLNAQKQVIQRVKGTFFMEKTGKMRVTKLDAMLKEIPSTWTPIKQSSMRIMLETLRDFDYKEAKGDFWFVDSQGILTLNLKGPAGSRNIEAVLHGKGMSGGRWQEKSADTR